MNNLCGLFYYSAAFDVGAILVLILQMRVLRHRGAKRRPRSQLGSGGGGRSQIQAFRLESHTFNQQPPRLSSLSLPVRGGRNWKEAAMLYCCRLQCPILSIMLNPSKIYVELKKCLKYSCHFAVEKIGSPVFIRVCQVLCTQYSFYLNEYHHCFSRY